MYISGIRISGYRNFKDVTIPLHEGINVVVGANNSGKSNLLSAIALVLNVEGHRRISIQDIFCETDIGVLRESSPKVQISLFIRQSENENDASEEAGIMSECIIDVDPPYAAQLNFSYGLSPEQEEEYKDIASSIEEPQAIWSMIERRYSRFYEIRRWGGKDSSINGLPRDLLDKIDIQFLDAIRDVGRDMYMGYNPLLKEILDFFLDYEIKIDPSKTDEEKSEALRVLNDDFRQTASPLMEKLMGRLNGGKEIMLKYASDIGASFYKTEPDFVGNLTEFELFSVLRMILKYVDSGIEIPAILNGLGYNNLIYISLLLSKMQANADVNFMKRQTKLYSMLIIEEPEAHLHPAMQYQFLNFLKKNQEDHKIRQTIITSHSTHMLSAARLEDIICLHTLRYGEVGVGYPRKLLEYTDKDCNSRAYIQRYLDATRADIFFARKLIFVEGMAEVLLLPTFAKYLGYDLAREHVLVVNMGGRYFDHFLKLFNTNVKYSIDKRVACLIDADPCREVDGRRRACFPYERDCHSNDINALNSQYEGSGNIKYFSQDELYGKTLEYDIAWANPQCKLLITQSISNGDEIEKLMNSLTLEEMKGALRRSNLNERIKSAIDESYWDDEEKKKAIVASRYLMSVGKGGNALELSLALEENYKLSTDNPEKVEFHVPLYIEEALRWLLT